MHVEIVLMTDRSCTNSSEVAALLEKLAARLRSEDNEIEEGEYLTLSEGKTIGHYLTR